MHASKVMNATRAAVLALLMTMAIHFCTSGAKAQALSGGGKSCKALAPIVYTNTPELRSKH